MRTIGWSSAAEILSDFGGNDVTLHVPKTGLPFFDVLCLYGAIDLYIGLREDVNIHDAGTEWHIMGYSRTHHVSGRDEDAFKQVWNKKKPKVDKYCRDLRSYIYEGKPLTDEFFAKAERHFSGFDAVLQTGIRGISACRYETLQIGQTSKPECKSKIPLSCGILAFAGKKRTERLGNVRFLPVFEGRIDLSKVVSPLRARIGLPNVLCSQVLALLSLKSALFLEGYQERLSAVVYNTNLGSRRSDNYSGLVSIRSTTIGKIDSSHFIHQMYIVFRTLVSKAWRRQGNRYESTSLAPDALAMAHWLMKPVGKHLSSMITSQERLKAKGYFQIFIKSEFIQEVFKMSYGNWKGDHRAVHKFAKAVATAIYHARQAKTEKKKRGKVWYDEVTMLRSSSSAKTFIHRALTLIEQGHKEHDLVGTGHWNEDFDPSALLTSIGERQDQFETFRDLFRMYLIQESTYKMEGTSATMPNAGNIEANNSGEE